MSAGAATLDDLRRERLTRQGLRSGHGGALVEAVASLLGVPMPAGASGVLALRARGLLSDREALDEAWLRRGELSVVPGPRGIAWLCASADAALLRSFAVADHAAREARVAATSALTARDLSTARDALRAALRTPLTGKGLRAALPRELTAPLGGAAQRAGASTLAGLVLRGMWCVGEVSRAPTSERADGDDFRYAIDAHPRVTPNAAESVDLVAARWFRANAPASPRAFAAAFGIAAGRAAAAIKRLSLRPIRTDERDEPLLTPGDIEVPPWSGDEVVALGVRDPLTDANPTLSSYLAPPEARGVLLRGLGPGPVLMVNGAVRAAWWVDATGEIGLRPVGADDAALRALSRGAIESLKGFVGRAFDGVPALHGVSLPRPPPPLSAEVGGGL